MLRVEFPGTTYARVHQGLRALAIGRLLTPPNQLAGLRLSQWQAQHSEPLNHQTRHRQRQITRCVNVARPVDFGEGFY